MNSKYSLVLLLFFVSSVFVSCKQHKNNTKNNEQINAENLVDNKIVSEIVWNDSVDRALRDEAYKAALITTRVLGKKLHTIVNTKGAEYAVDFCSKEAMHITDSVSAALGLKIKRLAKKYRNPDNETLGKDSLIFKKYVLDWLGHQPVKEQILIDDDNHPVYYNPIRVKHFCLTCHGEPGKTMDMGLSEKIKKLYAHDKATGFKEGQLRGMWVITFPQYTVAKRHQ